VSLANSDVLATPPISSADFAERLERIRSAMRERGYEACVVASAREHAVRYLGVYDAEMPSRPYGFPQIAIVLLPLEAEPVVFFRTFGFLETRIRAASLVDDVRIVEGTELDTLDALATELVHLGLADGSICLAGGELDWALAPLLAERLSQATLITDAAWLHALRVVKEPAEVELIRRSQLIADIGLAAAVRFLEPGQSDFSVYAAALAAMIAAGADENSFGLIGVAAGPDTELAEPLHGITYGRDDVVVYEALPFYRMYNTELMGAVALGGVSNEQKDASAVCDETLNTLELLLGPGRSTAELAAHCAEHLQAYGGPTHEPGHFLGLDNYEGPGLANDTILQPRMVLTLHPNVVVPHGPKAISHGVYLVTEDGADNLSSLPRRPLYRRADADELDAAIARRRQELRL
jgi:Xaa-Pro aminopeptidase